MRAEPHDRRGHPQEAERVVDPEDAAHRRRLSLVVSRPDDPAPATEHELRGPPGLRRARPGDPVDPRSPVAGLAVGGRAGRVEQARRDVRLPDELVRERLLLVLAVTVGREHGLRRRRCVDTHVLEREHLLDQALSAAVRGSVEELPVEGHRARAAGVERGRGHAAEPHERLRELPVRQADAVAAAPTVHDHHHDASVSALADARTGIARAELAREEVLAGRVDGPPVPDDHWAAAESVVDPRGRPVRSE